jgi:hypothetical protein
MKKWRTRKVDGSWFFDPEKWNFDQKVSYSDLSKIRPHKKHCAWARTPPWEFYKIYWNLSIFSVFGPSIEPGKPSPKSASTPYPPLGRSQKVEKMLKKWKLSKFIDFIDHYSWLRRIYHYPISSRNHFYKIYYCYQIDKSKIYRLNGSKEKTIINV